MKPNFIGIGAQKCATTWVYRILEDHPQAMLSEPKELHFFSSYFDHGYQWYESCFGEPAVGKVAGEYSTTYFYSADAAARAHSYNPDFKIIVTLRDPVSRAFSNHLHEVRVGHIRSRDKSYEACENDNPMYLEQSRYAKQLKKWLAHFDRERIIVLFQEEIASNPLRQAEALYRFLGISQSHVSPFLNERVNVSAVDRSGMVRQISRIGAKAIRQVAGDRFVRKLKANSLVSGLQRANKIDLAEMIPEMRPETVSRLRTSLAADMRALAHLLGRDELPWASWSQR